MELNLQFFAALETGRQRDGITESRAKKLVATDDIWLDIARSTFFRRAANLLKRPIEDAILDYMRVVAKRLEEGDRDIVSGTLNLGVSGAVSDALLEPRRNALRKKLATNGSPIPLTGHIDTVEKPALRRFHGELNNPQPDDIKGMNLDPGDFADFLDGTRSRVRPAKVVVLGLAVMDLHFRVPGFPERGASVQAKEFGMYPGGKGLTQAVACARLGMEAHLVSVVGDDANGEAILEKLRKEGVDTTHVPQRIGGRTSVTAVLTEETLGVSAAIGWKNEEGLHFDSSRLDANGDLKNLLQSCDFLLATFEIPEDALIRAVKLAKGGGATTIITPAPPFARIVPNRHLIDYLVAAVWELAAFATLHGMQLDTPQRTVEALATAILDDGTRNVVALDDAECLAYLRRGTGKVYEAVPTRPKVGMTRSAGARDAFCAMLAHRLHETAQHGEIDVHGAISWATAAFSLARRGDLNVPGSMPTLEEISAEMNIPE